MRGRGAQRRSPSPGIRDGPPHRRLCAVSAILTDVIRNAIPVTLIERHVELPLCGFPPISIPHPAGRCQKQTDGEARGTCATLGGRRYAGMRQTWRKSANARKIVTQGPAGVGCPIAATPTAPDRPRHGPGASQKRDSAPSEKRRNFVIGKADPRQRAVVSALIFALVEDAALGARRRRCASPRSLTPRPTSRSIAPCPSPPCRPSQARRRCGRSDTCRPRWACCRRRWWLDVEVVDPEAAAQRLSAATRSTASSRRGRRRRPSWAICSGGQVGHGAAEDQPRQHLVLAAAPAEK